MVFWIYFCKEQSYRYCYQLEQNSVDEYIWDVHDCWVIFLQNDFNFSLVEAFGVFVRLTHKQLEMYGCVLSTVVTDALVLKHQAISIYSAD